MTDELFSLRVLVVGIPGDDQDLLCQALSSVSVPLDIATAEAAASAASQVARGADLVYLDSELTPADLARIIAAARAAPGSPFTVQFNRDGSTPPFETDALADKPTRPAQTKRFVERSVRVRLPSRALVVDDSPTMRSIVRKLLEGTRFPLQVTEAGEGFAALKLARENDFDLVFLDYNMPGFSGLETLAEFKREKRRIDVVLMTSATDQSLAERAGQLGAAFLKKPFFAADIEAVMCAFYGFRALNSSRR